MWAEWPHMVSAIRLLAVTLPPIGFLLLARTPLLLPSMSLIALAIAAIVALAAWCLSSNRHGAGIPCGISRELCVHRVCSRHAQRSSTSDRVLIRVSGASSIIVSDQFAQQTRITQPHQKPELSTMLHLVSNEVTALLQVIMIDLVLAGDNAIVIGLAAAG